MLSDQQTMLKSSDSSELDRLAQSSYEMESIEDRSLDTQKYLYKCTIKSPVEPSGYLVKYEEVPEQDSLNYSSSEDISNFSLLVPKNTRMSEWIKSKMKGSIASNASSVVQFDAHINESSNKNPFELASSIEDKSSFNRQTISVEDIIDSTFINSILELGNRKRTILMQIEEKPESCQCGMCPII